MRQERFVPLHRNLTLGSVLGYICALLCKGLQVLYKGGYDLSKTWSIGKNRCISDVRKEVSQSGMEVPRIRVPLMLDHLVALMFCLPDCYRSCFAASTNLCLHLRRQEGSDVEASRLRIRWLGFTTPDLLDNLGYSCGATQRAVFLARLEVFQQKQTADIAAKCTAFIYHGIDLCVIMSNATIHWPTIFYGQIDRGKCRYA